MHRILKFTVAIGGAQINFANRKAQTVANVLRGSPASATTFIQAQSNVSDWQRVVLTAGGSSLRPRLSECRPEEMCASPSAARWDKSSGPTKSPYCTENFVANGAAHKILIALTGFDLTQVDHQPLRVKRIFLSGEMFIKIWITLPECSEVAVVDARVSIIVCLIDCVSSPGQAITIGKFYWPPPACCLKSSIPDGAQASLHVPFGFQCQASPASSVRRR